MKTRLTEAQYYRAMSLLLERDDDDDSRGGPTDDKDDPYGEGGQGLHIKRHFCDPSERSTLKGHQGQEQDKRLRHRDANCPTCAAIKSDAANKQKADLEKELAAHRRSSKKNARLGGAVVPYNHRSHGTERDSHNEAIQKTFDNARTEHGRTLHQLGWGKSAKNEACPNCGGDQSKWQTVHSTGRGKSKKTVHTCHDSEGKPVSIHFNHKTAEGDEHDWHRLTWEQPHDKWHPDRGGEKHNHTCINLRNSRTGATLEYCPQSKTLGLTHAHADSQNSPDTIEHPHEIAKAIRHELKNNPQIRSVHALSHNGGEKLQQVMTHLGAEENKKYFAREGSKAWIASRNRAIPPADPKRKFKTRVEYNHSAASPMDQHIKTVSDRLHLPVMHPNHPTHQMGFGVDINKSDRVKGANSTPHQSFADSDHHQENFGKKSPTVIHSEHDNTVKGIQRPRANSPLYVHRIDHSNDHSKGKCTLDGAGCRNTDGLQHKKHPKSMPPLHSHTRLSLQTDDGKAKADIHYCPYRKSMTIASFDSPSEHHSHSLLTQIHKEAQANPHANVIALTGHPHVAEHMDKAGAKTVWRYKNAHPSLGRAVRLAGVKAKNFHEPSAPSTTHDPNPKPPAREPSKPFSFQSGPLTISNYKPDGFGKPSSQNQAVPPVHKSSAPQHSSAPATRPATPSVPTMEPPKAPAVAKCHDCDHLEAHHKSGSCTACHAGGDGWMARHPWNPKKISESLRARFRRI